MRILVTEEFVYEIHSTEDHPTEIYFLVLFLYRTMNHLPANMFASFMTRKRMRRVKHEEKESTVDALDLRRESYR